MYRYMEKKKNVRAPDKIKRKELFTFRQSVFYSEISLLHMFRLCVLFHLDASALLLLLLVAGGGGISDAAAAVVPYLSDMVFFFARML